MNEKKSAILNRYSAEQVAFWIDGYYLPGPMHDPQKSFKHAKEQLIDHMFEHIRNIEAMTFEQWIKMKEAGI